MLALKRAGSPELAVEGEQVVYVGTHNRLPAEGMVEGQLIHPSGDGSHRARAADVGAPLLNGGVVVPTDGPHIRPGQIEVERGVADMSDGGDQVAVNLQLERGLR